MIEFNQTIERLALVMSGIAATASLVYGHMEMAVPWLTCCFAWSSSLAQRSLHKHHEQETKTLLFKIHELEREYVHVDRFRHSK